jgi:diacylglycerol O-acyltransferase / wax synthase
VPMPINDAVFLLAETRERPLHVGGLHLYKAPEEAGPHYVGEVYRDALAYADRVDRRLRRHPVRSVTALGAWEWRDDEHLDLEYHVRHSALPHPGRIRELLALVSRLHGTLLDRSRPLWESHIIEGLRDERFASYTKVHHALVDGVSAMRLLERGLTTDPDARDMPPPFAERPRREERDEAGGGPLRAASAAVGGAVDGVRGIVGATDAAVRSLARAVADEAATFPYKAPPSPLNVAISGARRFAADSWPLERIRTVGSQLGGTVNDVVLAMSAGALRRYLLDLDGLPDRPLVAMVPVALERDEDDLGNAVGIILCNLGTHLEDPLERFELIHRSSQTAKLRLEDLNQMGVLMLSAMSFGPLGLGPLFRFRPLRRPPFNVIISNVPGPRERLYWNGAMLDGMYPASIPVDGQALNITCNSYADRMGFGLTGCRRSVPHLQRLLTHLDESLAELEKAAAA